MPSFQYLQGSIRLHYVHTVGILNDPNDNTRHVLMHTTLIDKVLEKLTMLLSIGRVNLKASFQYSLYLMLWCHVYLDFVPPQLSIARNPDRSHLD